MRHIGVVGRVPLDLGEEPYFSLQQVCEKYRLQLRWLEGAEAPTVVGASLLYSVRLMAH
jgi:hypothetical protein